MATKKGKKKGFTNAKAAGKVSKGGRILPKAKASAKMKAPAKKPAKPAKKVAKKAVAIAKKRPTAASKPKKPVPAPKKVPAPPPKKAAASVKKMPAPPPKKAVAAPKKMPAPPKRAARTAAARAKTSAPLRREDHAGHFDPRYVAALRELSGPEDDENTPAFLDGPRSPKDDLAEELGEEVVAAATSGEDGGEEVLDQVVDEEQGGPFVQTSAAQEFAPGTDASNPKSAKREPFPTT